MAIRTGLGAAPTGWAAYPAAVPPRQRTPLAPPGSDCVSDLRGMPHQIADPLQDRDLQSVSAWLLSRPLESLLTTAVSEAVDYVLDGARTWRFDLNSPDVDSDERRTVGTKLQYRVLAALGLEKEPPLDTRILGIAVELKGTVGSSWMIPREGQCEICMLIQVDTTQDRHRAFLMRTHRLWLNAPNQDQKRSIRADALNAYGIPLVGWAPLPVNPLKRLTQQQREVVFAPRVGQARRLTALFGYLPEVVIPRASILTVCANRADPMRRARQIKDEVLATHGLWLLCGTWVQDRHEAQTRGYDLSGGAWVAVRP